MWKSDQPVNFFNVVAGRWQVREGTRTKVFYDERHAYNVDEMSLALESAYTVLLAVVHAVSVAGAEAQ